MGINPPAVDSDMVHYANPKALIRHLSRWKRAQERSRQEARSWREAHLFNVNYFCRLASIILAGSPPYPAPAAGPLRSGSWGR